VATAGARVKPYLDNPDLLFSLIDSALAFALYIMVILLLLKHKRGPITPVLFFGLFVFPTVFAYWFLSDKIDFMMSLRINPLEIFYLLFLKICVLLSLVFSRS
jgi:hypothetical protein